MSRKGQNVTRKPAGPCVVRNRPRSYGVLLQNADPYRRADHPYTNHDVYVTDQNPCEQIAAQDFDPPCGTEVDQFVNGEPLTHPVMWLQSSFHHRPRVEDEPLMDEKWLSFELVPRRVKRAKPFGAAHTP
ncbi:MULTISPECIES: hypothetical protein [unclassified Leifsonia]|uniref:copper amine oxidase n=1 Tax=Leifsonia sp. CL154 TaxID=1798214 RepID=UPI000B7E9DE4